MSLQDGSSAKELETALKALEELARRSQAPSHYAARHLLLALGKVLGQGPTPLVEAALTRARRAGETLGSAWAEAVAAELGLACGEFAQGVDPRYLGLPNYDLEYTRSARARLEDRLRAAQALGFELSPRETDVLALADQVLSTFLARRKEREGTLDGRPGVREGARPTGSASTDNFDRK